MKRHLVVLAPLTIFLFFVGCGGDDPAPIPPAVAANPEMKKLECTTKRVAATCQSAMSPELLLALTAQSNGQGNGIDPAFLIALLNKPAPRTDVPPPSAGNCVESAPLTGPNNEPLSCRDAALNAVLLAKQTRPDPNNGASAWELYQRHYAWMLSKSAERIAAGLNLNPLQKLQLASNLQTAVGQSGITSSAGLDPANVSYVNQALASYQQQGGGQQFNTATLNTGTTQNNLGATLNQNSGLPTNTFAQTGTNGIQSTSLRLGMGVRKPTSNSTGTGTATRQTLERADMRAARGFGLPTGTIGRR